MSDHTAVIDRVRQAAERIEVTDDLDSITDGVTRLRVVPTSSIRRPHRAMLVAACFALAGAVGVGVAVTQRHTEPSSSADLTGKWQPPLPVPAGAPIPGSVAAAVAAAPPWLTDLTPAFRDGNLRSGHWVSAAIATSGTHGHDDPIVISVFDGVFAPLAEAARVDINGQIFETVRVGAWQALATTTSPTVMVAGAVELTELSDVMSGTRIMTNGSEFTVALDALPDGYDLIVAPQTLSEDVSPRRTLTSPSNAISINEVSDWVDPLLYAAGVGTDITRRSVGGATGWSGTTNERTPLAFLVWSPSPGVVLEVTTTDTELSIDDLIALAEQARAIPIADWERLYPG